MTQREILARVRQMNGDKMREQSNQDQGPPSSAGDPPPTPIMTPGDPITRVRDLAWTGQHAVAIDLATQALAAPAIALGAQMDLLDLRAESYIAQGKFDLAAQDAGSNVRPRPFG